MQPRPLFDRALLIPIAIGAVSILGIGWILLTSDLGESLTPPTPAPSSMSLVEALTASPWALPTWDEPLPTATGTSPAAPPELPTETPPSTSIFSTKTLPPPSATPTPERIRQFAAGKYDDTDPNIAYDRYWTALKTGGTANAYRGTIHVSAGIGDEASFRFTGTGFRLGYQRNDRFGVVTVLVDDKPYTFNQQAVGTSWRSPELSLGDHFVRIIHASGQSINLDYIQIID
jgi:hypothetical protein